ncbi:MAG: glycosyltransferase [bacterium]
MNASPPIPAHTSWQNQRWQSGMIPAISVVFPTYRRPDTLGPVLEALNAQTGLPPEAFEVVVCDDASGDTAPATLLQASAQALHPMTCVVLSEQGGPARARNAALRFVRAPVVLLLGDDILAPPDLVARHMQWHAAHPAVTEALLGASSWDDTPPPTVLMRWLEQGGRHYAFNYRDLPVDCPVSGHFFYTCHVSFKKGLFTLAGGFDESFPFASHEDLELGLRMERHGMQLTFDPTLVVRHRHWMNLQSICTRIYRMGYSSIHFYNTGALPLSRPRALARNLLMRLFASPWARRTATRLAGPATPSHPRPLRWRLLLASMYWSGAYDAAQGKTPLLPSLSR